MADKCWEEKHQTIRRMSCQKFVWMGALLCAQIMQATVTSATTGRSTFSTVIDTTASMGDDISEVCDVMTDLASSVSRRFNDFVFVPFNDVGGHLTPYGPAQRLATADALRQQVCGWRGRVSGGGDCPELSLSGLSLAVQQSSEDSVIVVFTDASARDLDKLGSVLADIQRKRIKVFYLLSGTCGESGSAGYQAYYTIAATSGGQVSTLGEVNIPALLRFILSSQGSLSCPSNSLVIGRSAPRVWTQSFTIPANTDSLTAQVSCDAGRPVVSLQFIDSRDEARVSTVNLPNGLLLTSLNPKSSFATVRVIHTGACSVNVNSAGCSQAYARVFGFSARLNAPLSPIPQVVSSYLHFQSQPGSRITQLRFISPDGRVLSTRHQNTIVTKSDGTFILGRYNLPNEAFRLEVSGVDSHGKPFVTLSNIAYDTSLLRSPTVMSQVPAANRFEAVRCSVVTVSCSVRLEGREVPVTWSKDGRSLSTDDRLEVSGQRGEILKIKAVVNSDGGIYTCYPATASGVRTSASLYMAVRENANVREEDCNLCTTLVCPDSPVSAWYHNSTRLSSTLDYVVEPPNTLKSCRRPLAARAGQYTCVTPRGSWSFTVSSTFQTVIGEVSGSSTSRETVLGGCTVYGGVGNGKVVYSSLGRGTQAAFSCEPGYTLSGSVTSDCVSARWSSSSPPVCLSEPTIPPTTVPAPPPAPRTVVGGCLYWPRVANGQVSYQTVSCGTRATTTCIPGYEVEGLTHVYCLAGSWHGSSSCVPVAVPTIPSAMTTAMPDCETPLREAQARNRQLQANIQDLAVQVGTLAVTVSDKDKEVSGLTDDVESLQLTVTALRLRVSGEERASAALQAENTGLKRTVSNLRRTVATLRQENAILRANTTATSDKLKDCNTKLTAIQIVLGTCPAP